MSAFTNEIQKLYIAYFNRPADPGGLAYWESQLAGGATLAQVENSFSSSAEYQAIYQGTNTLVLINQLYQNLFGRDADAGGLLWWNSQLQNPSSGVTITTIASQLSSGTTPGSADANAINNKIAAASQFSTSLATTSQIIGYTNEAAFASARTWLSTVTSDAATLTTALGSVDTAVSGAVTAGSASTGQTFTLTDGVDSGTAFTGGAGNDTFISAYDNAATAHTYSGLDELDGAGGTDTLTITDAVGDEVDLSLGTVVNIETLNLTSVKGLAADADVSGFTGLTTANFTLNNIGTDTAITAAGTTAVTLSGAVGTASDIDVTGGSTVTVSLKNTADNSGKTITVTGEADATTTVSVTQTGTAANAAAVAVVDPNQGSGDDDSTITTVSLTGLQQVAATIASDAFTTLNLTDSDQNVTVTAAAKTRALAITVDNVTAGTIKDAEATSVGLTVNGDDSAFTLTTAKATTLTVGGDGAAVTLTNGALTALATLTISGTTAVTSNVSGAAELTTITSTSTGDQALTIAATATSVTTGAGDDTISQTAVLAATQNISTGAGDDTVVLGTGAANAAARVNGGDGTDTLSVVSGAVNTDHSAVISNFEVLTVSNALGQALNVANFDAIQNVVLAAGSGAFAISGLTSGATVTYGAANTGASTLTVTNAAVGLTDSINLVLSNAASKDFTKDVAVADVETITITSTDTATDNDPGDITHTIGLSDDHTTLNVSGDAGLIIDTAMTNVDTIGAAAFHAGLKVDLTGNANDATITTGDGDDNITVADADNTISAGDGANAIVAGNGDNTITVGDGDAAITVGNGDNTITGGESAGAGAVVVGAGTNTITLGDGDWTVTLGDGANTLVLGAGDDAVTIGTGFNTITGGAGTDNFVTTGNLNGGTYSVITDLEDGETITFSSDLGDASANGFTKITLGADVAFADYVLAATASTNGATGEGIYSWFNYNGNTFIVADNSDNASFEATVDEIIKFTGVIDLSGSAVDADAMVTYTAV